VFEDGVKQWRRTDEVSSFSKQEFVRQRALKKQAKSRK